MVDKLPEPKLNTKLKIMKYLCMYHIVLKLKPLCYKTKTKLSG